MIEQIFNNREIAVAIWVFILLCWAYTKKEIWESIKQVVLAFGNRHVLIIFGLMAGYICLVVHGLTKLGLWNSDQLKNTIMWFVFFASVEIFKANTLSEEKGYFKRSIKSHFKLLVLFQFVVAFHSFSLLVELIIVPLSVLVVLLMAFSEQKSEYKAVEKLMSWVLSVLGVILLTSSLVFIYSNFDKFAQAKTFFDFSVPIMLSILFLPFIYFISKYMLYESILVRVNIYTDNWGNRAYAKIKSLLHFGRDHKNLNKWVSYACTADFENRSTIDKSLRNFRA